MMFDIRSLNRFHRNSFTTAGRMVVLTLYLLIPLLYGVADDHSFTGSSHPSGWLNALSFGAEPNNENSDSSAIQKAIDHAEANGGGTIYLPRGTYLIDQSLQIHAHGIVLKGDGISTVLKNNGAEHAIIKSLSSDRSPRHTSLHHVIIEKMKIDGVDQTVTGIMASGMTRGSVIRDLYIINCFDGIDLAGCWSMSLERNNINNCKRTGIMLGEGGMRSEAIKEQGGGGHPGAGGSSIVNAVTLLNNTARGCEYGLRWAGGNGWFMGGNTFEGNRKNVFLRLPESGAILGNYFEASRSEAPLVTLGTTDGRGIAKNLVLGGNMFYDNSVDGLEIAGLIDSQILANRFSVGGDSIYEHTGYHLSDSVPSSRIYGNQYFRLDQRAVPQSPNSPGINGQIAWDSSYIYICVAPNQWVRAPLEKW